jgi:putative MATE family efflux protein
MQEIEQKDIGQQSEQVQNNQENYSGKNLTQNKMGVAPIWKLIIKMGLPMIISMILQSVYNIVDTAFVINMGEDGVAGNLALTYAFPIQLLIVAIGVGTGVGIGTVLSEKLGKGDNKGVTKIVGNGIFLAIVIYAIFLLFGLFGARAFISMQANGNEQVIEMGTNYLRICCCLCFGQVGMTVFERFLQGTGKTAYSALAQIAGAVTNIVLDYVFIYPLNMGIEGAAWATVIGQVLALVVGLLCHFLGNKEIKNSAKAIIPDWQTIKSIYHIGISAMIMQGLLSVMMLGVNLIFGTVKTDAEILQGSFGIYYKIMQFALFAALGLSNTIIAIVSFNYGMGDKKRVKEGIKFGVLYSAILALIITVIFESLATPLAELFGMASGEAGEQIVEVVVKAIRIASIGYVFMGISVGIQGVLQAFRYALSPLIISLLRLCVLVMPIAYLFSLSSNALSIVWWTFPIVEVITAVVSFALLFVACKKKVNTME